MKILGFAGRAGSGKTTAASFLAGLGTWQSVGIADPIKRALMSWYGWDENSLWGPSESRNSVDPRIGVSPRKALQHVGTEVARELYQNTWIDYAINVARTINQGNVVYSRQVGLMDNRGYQRCGTVFHDVRFQNEVDSIHNVGGKVILIRREGFVLDGSLSTHRSETELDSIVGFDRVINNAFDLETLEKLVFGSVKDFGL